MVAIVVRMSTRNGRCLQTLILSRAVEVCSNLSLHADIVNRNKISGDLHARSGLNNLGYEARRAVTHSNILDEIADHTYRKSRKFVVLPVFADLL